MKAFEPNKAISCLYENTLLDHADNTNIKPFITKRYDSRGHVQTRLSFPKSVDTVKSKLAGKTKAKSEVRKIKKILLMYKSISPLIKTSFYKLTITLSSKNYRWAGNANQPTLIDKQNYNAVNHLHSVMTNLRSRLRYQFNNQVKLTISNPVIKYPKDLHVHGLLTITNAPANAGKFTHISDVREYITKYLMKKLNAPINNAPVKLIEPLRLHASSTSSPVVIDNANVTNPTNYFALLQYLTYINKTDKLPVVKSWKDYYKVANAPIKDQVCFVLGVLNTTTQGKRIHYMAGFNQIIKRLTMVQHIRSLFTTILCNLALLPLIQHVSSSVSTLAGILSLLDQYHVQPVLFDPEPYIVKLAHYHRYNSTSFDRLVRSQTLKMEAHAILRAGRLSYKQAVQTAPRVPFRIASRVKACLTITFIALGIHYVEPFIISLFNSS